MISQRTPCCSAPLRKSLIGLLCIFSLFHCKSWDKFWLAPSITGTSTTWGGAGDTISIFGSGFGSSAADLQVTFNGTTASIQSVSPSEVKVVIPSGAKSGPIAVLTANGESARTTSDFRINKYYLYSTSTTALYGFQFDQVSGALTSIPNMPLITTSAVGTIVVAFESKYLYATSFSNNHVGSFAINQTTGEVTTLPTSPTAVGTGPGYLCIDSKSRYLFVSNGSTASIHGFSITESTGALSALSGSPYAAASQTLGIGIDPTDSFLFVNNELVDTIRPYTISSNGSLVAGTAVGSGDATRGLAIHPSLRYIFTTSTTSSDIHGYSYDTSGALTLLAGFPIALGSYAPWMKIDATGKYLYVAAQNSGAGIYGYSINATSGALTAIGGSPFSVSAFESRGLMIDPYNRYLVSARSAANQISVFQLQADGTITEVAGQTHAVGTQPQRFVFASVKQ